MSTARDNRSLRLLIVTISIVLTGIGISRLSNIWVDRAELVQVKGTLASARTYISMAFAKKRRDPHEETMSHKSELIFRLNEHPQEYHLVEGVGDRQIDDKYEAILQGLRSADSVFVWIKKSQQHFPRPQVFQISNDQTTLLPFEHLHIENDPITIVFILMGSLLIIPCLAAVLRDAFKRSAVSRKERHGANIPVLRN